MRHIALSKISKKLEKESLNELLKEMPKIKSIDGVANLLDIFFTTWEKDNVLRRIAAAKLIEKGYKYKKIIALLKVSKSTISNANDFLVGRGYGRNPGRKTVYSKDNTRNRKEKKIFRSYKGAESII